MHHSQNNYNEIHLHIIYLKLKKTPSRNLKHTRKLKNVFPTAHKRETLPSCFNLQNEAMASGTCYTLLV